MTYDELVAAFEAEEARVNALSVVDREAHYEAIRQEFKALFAEQAEQAEQRRVTTEVLNRVCNI